MSGGEQVESFNPLLVVIWATQLLLLGWDWSQDGKVLWSIPIIGSFFIIQLYMIWKTNYDQMMDENREQQARALGGPIDTPTIDPKATNLKKLYQTKETKKLAKPSSNININISPDGQEEE